MRELTNTEVLEVAGAARGDSGEAVYNFARAIGRAIGHALANQNPYNGYPSVG